MIKTITLKGKEQMVQGLGGFNTIVHNLGSKSIYASRLPNITAEADDVAEIPAGAAKLISTTNGTVYVLGTGKAELTGQDHDGVNFKQPSSPGGDGSTTNALIDYIDIKDAEGLDAAKTYTDTALDPVIVELGVLQTSKADKTTADKVNDGLMSKEDKRKLDDIEGGAQINTVNGVKGSTESGYRTGYIDLTAADVGAAETAHYHSTTDITSGVLPINRGGTGNSTGRVKAGQPSGALVNQDSTSEGRRSIASGDVSHAQGKCCAATGGAAHAQGYGTLAAGANSMSCGGGTVADQANQVVIGTHNKTEVGRSPFVIGWGTASSDRQSVPDTVLPDTPNAYSNYLREGNTPKNIFRIDSMGAAYGVGAYKTTGADYAEYIKPWWDDNPDNEDRRGYFVTIKNGKLHKAEPTDYIVGITSGNPSVVGNGDEDWLGRWQRDEFNELIYQDVEIDDYDEQADENGDIVFVNVGSHIEKQTVEVAEYDSSQSYIERKDRPEWSYVGMIGVIPLRDDGTCVAGGFAKCGGGGIATAADTWDCHKTFFVIERVNDHIISVEMR